MNWFKKLKVWQKVLVVFLAVGIVGAAFGGGDKDSSDKEKQESIPKTEEKQESTPKAEEKKEEPKVEKKEEPKETVTIGQRNALNKALDYLAYGAFSYTGLIKQLEFEKFSTSEATYAADKCGANWNDQAAKKAKDYISYSSFSRQGLIDQLKFEGFTQAQASHGATAVGY